MKRIILLCGLVLSVTLLSCQDDVTPDINELALVQALLNYNSETVAEEINKLSADLSPKTDVHETNLNTLMQRIEQQAEALEVTDFCYACIETFPPQSEIILNIDSLGTTVSRAVDILTPDDNILKTLRVH